MTAPAHTKRKIQFGRRPSISGEGPSMESCAKSGPGSGPGSGPRSGEKGFTLLEVLVALALMAIAFVAIFQLFSANLRGITASDDYVNAVMRAESKMREILDDDKLGERSWSETTDDGFRIDAVVTPTAVERSENLPVTLLEIKLTVRWTMGIKDRSLTLRTMKVINKQI